MHTELIVPNRAIYALAAQCTTVKKAAVYKQSNELGQDGKNANERHS